MTTGKSLVVLLAAACALGLAVPARAQSPTANPSAQDIVRALTKPAQPGVEMRGLEITKPGTPVPATPPSINLSVNFEFNSAQLTTDAELVLDRLGEALKDPKLAGARIQVAGHTDAVGGDAYNQRLSQLRAKSVVDYLVSAQKIAAARLTAVGFGRSKLLDPAHPTGAVNRRVEITNLGVGS